ncbi:hypothetical protein C8R43DRAFT_940386 [Mycena crocata]|nr:hypothetical protein C8R43DRAFT_940386 [Mycena crocata]
MSVSLVQTEMSSGYILLNPELELQFRFGILLNLEPELGVQVRFRLTRYYPTVCPEINKSWRHIKFSNFPNPEPELRVQFGSVQTTELGKRRQACGTDTRWIDARALTNLTASTAGIGTVVALPGIAEAGVRMTLSCGEGVAHVYSPTYCNKHTSARGRKADRSSFGHADSRAQSGQCNNRRAYIQSGWDVASSRGRQVQLGCSRQQKSEVVSTHKTSQLLVGGGARIEEQCINIMQDELCEPERECRRAGIDGVTQNLLYDRPGIVQEKNEDCQVALQTNQSSLVDARRQKSTTQDDADEQRHESREQKKLLIGSYWITVGASG